MTERNARFIAPYLDYVVSNLNEQLQMLDTVIKNIEYSRSYDEGYIFDTVKSVETELRRLRKFMQSVYN